MPGFCHSHHVLPPPQSFPLCGCGGLKDGNLTVKNSPTIAALQPGWEWSPMLFYRNFQRMTCLVEQPRLGLVQFSSSLCLLLPGLRKEMWGPLRLETCHVRPGDKGIKAWLLLRPLDNKDSIRDSPAEGLREKAQNPCSTSLLSYACLDSQMCFPLAPNYLCTSFRLRCTV